MIIRDRAFLDSPVGDGSGWDGLCFILDVKNLEYRYLGNSYLAFYQNIKKEGRDGFMDGFLAEVGLGFMLPETHSELKGVESYA
jgi:hypothetical protein